MDFSRVDAFDGAANIEEATHGSVFHFELTEPRDLGHQYDWVIMVRCFDIFIHQSDAFLCMMLYW